MSMLPFLARLACLPAPWLPSPGTCGSRSGRGIDKLVLVNGHGGNYVLSNVVQEANVAGRSMALFPVREDWDQARREAGCVGSTGQDMHAGELEVSLLLHVDPQLVGAHRSERDHISHPRPFLAIAGIGEYSKTGVIGLPSHGTAAKGKAILDSLSGSFAAHHDMLKTAQPNPARPASTADRTLGED